MPPDAFDDAVQDALDALPAWVLDALENVAVLVENEPADDDEELLGLFEGVPLTERSGGEPIEPARITLFRGPLERATQTPAELRDEIRTTVLHEIGHHLGLSEDRLDELGYG